MNNNEIIERRNKVLKISIVCLILLVVVIGIVFILLNENKVDYNVSTKETPTTTTLKTVAETEFSMEYDHTEKNVDYTIFKAENGQEIFFGRNNNDGVVNINLEIAYYDSNDKLIVVGYGRDAIVKKDEEFAFHLLDVPKDYDYYKLYLYVYNGYEDWYGKDKFNYELKDTGAFFNLKINEPDENIEHWFEISIVFLKNSKPVGIKEYLGYSKTKRILNIPYDTNDEYYTKYKIGEFDSYKVYLNRADITRKD